MEGTVALFIAGPRVLLKPNLLADGWFGPPRLTPPRRDCRGTVPRPDPRPATAIDPQATSLRGAPAGSQITRPGDVRAGRWLRRAWAADRTAPGRRPACGHRDGDASVRARETRRGLGSPGGSSPGPGRRWDRRHPATGRRCPRGPRARAKTIWSSGRRRRRPARPPGSPACPRRG